MKYVLALSLVLGLATSAAAECAWVLWATYADGRKPLDRGIEAAFATKADCEHALPGAVAQHISTWTEVYAKRGGKVTSRPPKTIILVDKDGSGSREEQMLIGLSCWPLGLQPKSVIGGAEYPERDSR